jgi:hypothetical protein
MSVIDLKYAGATSLLLKGDFNLVPVIERYPHEIVLIFPERFDVETLLHEITQYSRQSCGSAPMRFTTERVQDPDLDAAEKACRAWLVSNAGNPTVPAELKSRFMAAYGNTKLHVTVSSNDLTALIAVKMAFS